MLRFKTLPLSTFTKLAALGLAFTFFYSATAEARYRHARRHSHYRPAEGNDCGGNTHSSPAPARTANSMFQSGETSVRLVDARLVQDAQAIGTEPQLRKYNGGMVVITSGYRNCFRNAATPGSARHSAHLRGNAIDIRARTGGSPSEYASAIKQTVMARGKTASKGGFYNSCVRHVHLQLEGKDTFGNECGGRGHYGRKARRRRR